MLVNIAGRWYRIPANAGSDPLASVGRIQRGSSPSTAKLHRIAGLVIAPSAHVLVGAMIGAAAFLAALEPRTAALGAIVAGLALGVRALGKASSSAQLAVALMPLAFLAMLLIEPGALARFGRVMLWLGSGSG